MRTEPAATLGISSQHWLLSSKTLSAAFISKEGARIWVALEERVLCQQSSVPLHLSSSPNPIYIIRMLGS